MKTSIITIVLSLSMILVAHCKIQPQNYMNGPGNVVYEGTGNIANGRDNIFWGNDNQALGIMNSFRGNNNQATGTANDIKGKDNKAQGVLNKI